MQFGVLLCNEKTYTLQHSTIAEINMSSVLYTTVALAVLNKLYKVYVSLH